MSSAILYVAIVAIWACVLIPRWLRRSPARNAGNATDTAEAADAPLPGDVTGGAIPGAGDGETSVADAPVGTVLAGYTETSYAETGRADADTRTGAGMGRWKRYHRAAPAAPMTAGTSGAPLPLPPGEARQRMLAARRRLLGMLIVLQVAAIALALLGFAALWVLIPPAVMLIGYVLLLREAAHADTERAQRDQLAARARARSETRARERAVQPTQVASTVPAAATAPAAGADDWGSGRDFAPGLAGKYTTSNAEVIDMYEQADEDFGDGYRVQKLRAVGD